MKKHICDHEHFDVLVPIPREASNQNLVTAVSGSLVMGISLVHENFHDDHIHLYVSQIFTLQSELQI